MTFDSLGNRMKSYENKYRIYLEKKIPVIIRVDGKSFHSFTRGFEKPFDMVLIKSMWETAKALCANIQGCKLAYTQSDEISLLLTDYDDVDTSAWFDNNLQKIASISASIATLAFNKAFRGNANSPLYESKIDKAMFDSRAFIIPKHEVCNYFIWREQDAYRNSVQSVGQHNFSHKELQHKKCKDIKQMLLGKGVVFEDYPTYCRYGACIIKETYAKDSAIRNRWVVDENIPNFVNDRNYINEYI